MTPDEKPVLRVLIVDDEAPARARIRSFLQAEEQVRLVGECANGEQAVEAIRREKPDLVFLDIRMPRLDGFGVFERLAEDEMPQVVFTTAYDEYALKAFEVHAVDYLLKPFDRARFRKTLEQVRRVRSHPGPAGVSAGLQALLAELRAAASKPPRLAVKVDGRLIFLRPEEVDWVEAEGNYVKVHAGATVHLVRETLAWFEAQLPARTFLRISRSALVNTDRVKEVQPLFHGDQAVILRDGTRLTLSRTHRERLEQWLAGPGRSG